MSLGVSSQAAPQWYVCIDGGGTKLAVKVLDQDRAETPLVYENQSTTEVGLEGVNVNVHGEEQVKSVLERLFSCTKLVNGQSLQEVASRCMVVAAMAGVALPEPRAKVTKIFEHLGVPLDRLVLRGDAEMGLECIQEQEGVVAISGTGHVMFAKKAGQIRDANGKFYRVGGWGAADDKACGYYLGLAAIKAARSEQEESGENTRLTQEVVNFFGEQEARVLRAKLTPNDNAKVAAFAKTVFKLADEGDDVAKRLIERKFVHGMEQSFTNLVKNQNLSGCPVHIYGGLMKSGYADRAIEAMRDTLPADKRYKFTFHNQAHNNVAVVWVQSQRFR